MTAPQNTAPDTQSDVQEMWQVQHQVQANGLWVPTTAFFPDRDYAVKILNRLRDRHPGHTFRLVKDTIARTIEDA